MIYIYNYKGGRMLYMLSHVEFNIGETNQMKFGT